MNIYRNNMENKKIEKKLLMNQSTENKNITFDENYDSFWSFILIIQNYQNQKNIKGKGLF